MRLTIKKKLGLGIGIISSILIIIGLSTYFQIRFIDERIREITEVEDPTHAAAYEMEINAIGAGMGVLKYLDTSDPRYRKRVEEDAAEFKGFLDSYLRLTETPKEKELGKRLGNLFEGYRALGQSLMNKKDDQNTLFDRVALVFEKMDDIIDDRIQAKIDTKVPDGREKAQESLAMEGDIAEVGTWLGNYLRTLNEEYKKRIYDDVGDFMEELIHFKNLHLTEEEKHWAAELETLFNQNISDIGQIVTLNNYLHKKIPEFIDLRSRIDDLLDDEIQILTHKDLDLAKEDAHRTANRAVNVLLGLIIFALVFGISAAWRIVKSITRPVDKLVSATEVISKGDLSHRIDIRSEDEFGVLAESFNRMTDGLRNTTVSRNQLESIIDSMNESLMVVSPNGRIDALNPATCNILGYRKEELVGWPVEKIFKEELMLKSSLIDDLIKKAPIRNVEKTYLTKKGKKIPMLLSASVMHGDDSRVQGIVCVAMDIYKIRQVEQEKGKLQSQLIQAQKMEAVGTLAGGIAHDFNNTLQAISGYTQILLMGKDPADPDYEKLEAINNASHRAGDLVRQLLIFGRKVESKLRPMDLNQEVVQVSKMLERTIPKMIKIEQHLTEGLKTINADPVQLEQIMMNLGVNARDAMPDGGKLIFETENVFLDEEYCRVHFGASQGEYVLLIISDSGNGMEKEVLEHIFEPFYTTKETGKGTGLGLAMAYGIVKNHGGYIMCYSEPGQGTTFKIYFPVIKGESIERGAKPKEEKIAGGSETVLLVDDEENILDAAKEMLDHFGYKTITAESGEEAIEIVRKVQSDKERHGPGTMPSAIDLVILDMSMPGMGGHKCLRELLKIDPKTKVVISSGYSATGKMRETLESGAAGFIGKPYQLADMVKQVREILDKDL